MSTRRQAPATVAEVEASTGNVFADLELPDADDLLVKGELAVAIRRLIVAAGWTQQEAASRLDATQPIVSNLLRGRLDGFTFDRLLRYLTALGQDVRLVVEPKPATRAQAQLRATVRSVRPAPGGRTSGDAAPGRPATRRLTGIGTRRAPMPEDG